MKHSWYLFVLLLLSPVALTGCEVIGDIFKAGVWVGVVLVMLYRDYRLACYQEQGLRKAKLRRLIKLIPVSQQVLVVMTVFLRELKNFIECTVR